MKNIIIIFGFICFIANVITYFQHDMILLPMLMIIFLISLFIIDFRKKKNQAEND